ncbi:hypothetical protein [Nocardia stercoris]|uniref:Translation elongation factor-like protein n=1 Tax=Nocardia stercoris TaxID=2483361 RepID=A0A3M2KSQ5_9NOCA|nr:hypothetical protein [Nocardia stercoris]RMI28469.1 hypothetical protein EBN03_30065 [Nocardia stercoris]
MTATFKVTRIFHLTSEPVPFVVGTATGLMSIGDAVVLKKADGTQIRGTLDSMHVKRNVTGEISMMFSAEISENVEVGDEIRTDAG